MTSVTFCKPCGEKRVKHVKERLQALLSSSLTDECCFICDEKLTFNNCHKSTDNCLAEKSTKKSFIGDDDFATVDMKLEITTEALNSSDVINVSDPERKLRYQGYVSTESRSAKINSYVENSESEDDQNENSGASSDETYVPDIEDGAKDRKGQEASDETYTEDSGDDIKNRKDRRATLKRKTTLPCGMSLQHIKLGALQPEFAQMLEIVDDPDKPYKCKKCAKKCRDLNYILPHVCAHIGETKEKKFYQCNDCCDEKFNSFLEWSEHTRQFICKYACCGIVKNSKQSLKKHEEIHKNEEDAKLFKCKICGDQFSSGHKLRNHKEHAHVGVPLNANIGKDKKSKLNANAISDREIKISALSTKSRSAKINSYVENNESDDDQNENSGASSGDTFVPDIEDGAKGRKGQEALTSDETYTEDSSGDIKNRKDKRALLKRKTTLPCGVSLLHIKLGALQPEFAQMLEIVDDPDKPYKCKKCAKKCRDLNYILPHVCAHIGETREKKFYQCNDCCDKKFNSFFEWSQHTGQKERNLKHQGHRSTKFKGHSYVENREEEDINGSKDDEKCSDETYIEGSDDAVHSSKEVKKKVQKAQCKIQTTMSNVVSLPQFKIDALQSELGKMLEIVSDTEKPYKCKECPQQSRDLTYMLPHICAHIGKCNQTLKYYQCNSCCNKQFRNFMAWSKHTRQFVCRYPSCGVILESKQLLRNHKEIHENDEHTKMVACHICGDQFSSKHKLRFHKEHAHIGVPLNTDVGKDEKSKLNANAIEDRKIKISALAPDLRQLVLDESFPGIGFKCKFCDKSVTTKIGNFLAHAAEHIDDKHLLDKPYHCQHCGEPCDMTFETFLEWAIHAKPYRCEVAGCKFRVETRSLVRKHMMRVHADSRLSCPECSESFKSRYHLNYHLRTAHVDSKNYTCTVCGKRYYSKKVLIDHEARHRNGQPFKCHCGKRFTTPRQLKVHKMDHTGEKPFQCEICGFRTKTKIHLRDHLYRHSDNKPFKCEFCGKQMADLSWYKRHKQIHTGVGLLKCRYCDERFKYPITRTHHERKHPEWKGIEFTCEVCGKIFLDKVKFKRHLRIHTGEKPYGCSMCDYRSSRKDSLKKHLQKHFPKKGCDSTSTKPLQSNVISTERHNDIQKDNSNRNVLDMHTKMQNLALQDDVHGIHTENLVLHGEFSFAPEAQRAASQGTSYTLL